MPRDGSGTYSLPSGTAAVSGQTIESAKYNSAMDDLVDDANNARPVSAGGTGASSATGAKTNLGLVIGTDVQAFNAYLADIAGLTLDEGDLLYFDGSDIVKLAKGVTDQYLRMNAAATAPEWATFNSSIQDIAGITFVAGDIMYYDGSDLVRLPVGTSGQVLGVNSGGTAPEWGVIGIGTGQQWYDFTSSGRTAGTSYQNTTGSPIQVITAQGAGDYFDVSTDGSTWVQLSQAAGSSTCAIIPNNHYYRARNGFDRWAELR